MDKSYKHRGKSIPQLSAIPSTTTFAGILPTLKGYLANDEKRAREIHFNRINPSESRVAKGLFIYFVLDYLTRFRTTEFH